MINIEDSSVETDFLNEFIEDLVKDFLEEKVQISNDNKVEVSSKKNVNKTDLEYSDALVSRQLDMSLSKKGVGAKLRVLDKIYGVSKELKVIENGEIWYDSIRVVLNGCFYQRDNLEGDSLALVSISDESKGSETFTGWISARQSHLANYDNYRYSLWLLSCSMSDQE